MGRSTVSQLIARGKAENGYNNSGIDRDDAWVDFFNDALGDLVDDLQLRAPLTLPYDGSTRQIVLPSDFFAFAELYNQFGCAVRERPDYGADLYWWPEGYYILDIGGNKVIDLYRYTSAQSFQGLYIRYPAYIQYTVPGLASYPEVPTVGEKALIFYAIGKALRNNNQMGQAQDYERLYELERKKIRNATARARGN